MPYTVVKSFERGIDTRKLIDTTEAGALLEGRDCHITLGGELEKRAAFVVVDTLPGTTVGLWVTEGRVYHTWGDAATPPSGLPAGTIYHSIPEPVHPAQPDAVPPILETPGTPLVQIRSVEEFNGGLYVIAQYEDGHFVHWWYSGGADIPVVVKPPEVIDDGSGGAVTPPTTSPTYKPQVTVGFRAAIYLNGGEPTTMHCYWIYLLAPSTTYNFTPGPTQDAWMLIPQTGTTGGRPSGDISVSFPGNNGQDLVAAIMEAINTTVTTPKVQCQAGGSGGAGSSQIQFWIDVPGTLYNGYKLEIRTSATVRSPDMGPYTFSGGIAAPPAPPGPPPAPPPSSDVGQPVRKGYFAIAHNYRMFCVNGSMLNFSAPKDPTEWDNFTKNAGFIDHSMVSNRAPYLTSMADYGGDLAVFGKRHIFIWHIGELPGGDAAGAGDFKRQTIHGTGTFAPHSATPWGQSDVMYLDTSGIRSLRARDSSEQAFSADIGTMIDSLVREQIALMTEDDKLFHIWGIVEPRAGRLWMAIRDKIFVLSFYPSSRISAWTWYDATEAPVDMMNSSDDSVYWRSGNNIIVYGGVDGDTYDDTEGLARIPYIDGGKPATHKNWTGFDAAVYGTWQVRGSFDPTLPAALDLLANITKSTYQQQKIAVNGESPAISLELTTTFVGPAKIGNAALHYTDSTAD
jgi:hypothetical protein